ncbi:hypothetical protein ABPG75_004614 [Micractinium tetrahymenae]
MMRMLSNALALERSGSASPRVHPSEDGVDDAPAVAPAAIPAVRKKGTRISFADTALVATLGVPGAPGGPLPRGRVNSLLLRPDGKPAALAPRPSILRHSLLAVQSPPPPPPRLVSNASEGSEATTSDRKSSVFDLLERKRKPASRWRAALLRFLQSGPFLLVSLLLTIMILYSDSFRVAATPKSADPYFLAFSFFVLGFFSLEAAAGCLANPRYARSFYFWVDVVATASILLDIPAVVDPIISSANDGNGDVQQRSGMENAAQITGASTRAARLAQVTKWMRLWQIIKLFAIYCKNRRHIIDRRTFIESELEASSQSRVGEKLTELTIRKVIIMVLLVMFAMPVFDVSVGYYGGAPLLDNGGLDLLHVMYNGTRNPADPTFLAVANLYIVDTEYRMGRGYTGVCTDLSIFNGSYQYSRPGGVEGLRTSEIATYTSTPVCGPAGCRAGAGLPPGGCWISTSVFDMKWDAQIQGILEMGRTTFTIIILLLGAAVFIADTDRLVLKPLERMVQLLREVSENPLAKLSRKGGAAGSTGGSVFTASRKSSGLASDPGAVGAGRACGMGCGRRRSASRAKTVKALETQVLESSIHKICSLLSVGFGEAGAEVIADNMRSGGDLNPMVPGRKVAAIFGFCDIRSFTDATEVLQEEVMEFVNSIAQIVHQEVALHGGAANKNIGDAFLLVWKLSGGRRMMDASHRSSLSRAPSATSRSSSGAIAAARGSSAAAERLSVLYGASSGGSGTEGTLAKQQHLTAEDATAATADQALASFIIIQAALKRSAKLRQYCQREDLNQRMPGYEVNMGFGLHVGWAIEGAIGSEYKIDASYLSPHVNMASRLEAATKQYGATILMSEEFVRMLSPGVRTLVRQVDCVTVKGSNKPVGLYTYDVDVEGLDGLKMSQHKPLVRVQSTGAAVAAAAAAAVAEEGKSQAVQAVVAAAPDSHETFSCRSYRDEFAEHPDIVMTRAVDDNFLAKFSIGFAAYRSGDWPTARAALEETVEMRRDRQGRPVEDGPSATLLRVMARHGYQAPSDWAGYRELTEK